MIELIQNVTVTLNLSTIKSPDEYRKILDKLRCISEQPLDFKTWAREYHEKGGVPHFITPIPEELKEKYQSLQ